MLLLCLLQIAIIQVTVLHFTPKIEAYSQKAAIDYYKGFQGKDVYMHALGFKSYAAFFYTRELPATNNDYHSLRVDKNGKDIQPIANEPWLIEGAVDKPTYFICKIQDSAKYAALPQLEVTGSSNGFVFLKRR